MKKRVITIAAAAVLVTAISSYMIICGDSEHSVLANIINETTEADVLSDHEKPAASETETETESEEASTIVIPDDAERYGSINISNGGTDTEIDYTDPVVFNDLGSNTDLKISGTNFYYEIKGSSIDSVTVHPQEGLILSGTDYSYEICLSLEDSDKKIVFSGKSDGELNISRSRSEISLDSKTVFGDINVTADGENYHYQINATSCNIESDGSMTLKDGTKISTALENVNGISKEALAENVFHTIEPALFVRGNSTAIANAAAYINDFVYDNEEAASALTDDTAISEYYEYYGEKGNLSFSITIFSSGNHARIITSDGEVHDYLIEAQKGAHCYPVFSL